MDSLPSDTLALPNEWLLLSDSKDHQGGNNGRTQFLWIAYLAIHSILRVNGHYCQAATLAGTGIWQKANAIGSLPSDTLALPSQRSLLLGSNAR